MGKVQWAGHGGNRMTGPHRTATSLVILDPANVSSDVATILDRVLPVGHQIFAVALDLAQVTPDLTLVACLLVGDEVAPIHSQVLRV